MPYMACKGNLSASEAWRAGQRFERAAEAGKDLVLFHLGDQDPSGVDMTRDNGDRVELYSSGQFVDVRRLALNMDQVEEYSPPPNPVKLTDSRAEGYVAQFGTSSWELDALEPFGYRPAGHSQREKLDRLGCVERDLSRAGS